MWARHRSAFISAGVVFCWELGVNIALQKGYFDATPNWSVFALLFVPLFGLTVVGWYHPWMTKLRKEGPRRAFALLLCGLGLLLLSGYGLFRLTHPAAGSSKKASEWPTNAPAMNPSPVIQPSSILTEKRTSENPLITIGGDNNGNVAPQQFSIDKGCGTDRSKYAWLILPS